MGGGADRQHRNAYRATQKKQRRFYSGKKKRHTLKSQLVIDYETRRILEVAQAPGPSSDLKLFQKSSVHLSSDVWCLADGGYRGLEALHRQTALPVRKPKGGCLSEQDRHNNRRLAKLRIRVEHVICWLKRFRILAERYRNRRRRFGLRFRLIAGLYNFEAALT